MRVYRDDDADLTLLRDRRIAVIGYGNQGRAQALNLRDSGLQVIIGNRADEYAARAREDGFSPLPIARAATEGDVVMLLIPDEVMPEVFRADIAPYLSEGKALVFASAYNVAFEQIVPPPTVDVILVAPRMIGAGVRDLYRHSDPILMGGAGFPSFIGVAQDRSSRAQALALALAKGIGSTRMGVVQVTFRQEAELDLFTEQCFGPAFGHVLTSAVGLLLEEGYPPEAVLLELYMSGELSYTMQKIAELGLIEQSALHSRTSQYGSMSRGMRFMLPELRIKLREGLDDIRSGRFVEEWAAEKAAGCPTLEALREAARSLPLYQLERELRQALGSGPATARPTPERKAPSLRPGYTQSRKSFVARAAAWLRGLGKGRKAPSNDGTLDAPLRADQVTPLLHAFLARAVEDPALRRFAQSNAITTHYLLTGPEREFYLRFEKGAVTGELGPPPAPAEVLIQAEAEVLDGMLIGRINAMRAAMTGKLVFSGDTRLAIGIQHIQGDLCRLYRQARKDILEKP
jgi:ketol-acid reductoisomerase